MRSKNNFVTIWLLLLPVIAFFYIGLFLTMTIWYPEGLSQRDWQTHLLNFSIVYLFWLIAFLVNHLFDLDTLRSLPRLLVKLFVTSIVLVFIAVIYFYFQPQLLITPRRFLLVHVFISSMGIYFWYTVMHMALPRTWRQIVFGHQAMAEEELRDLVNDHGFLGLSYGGIANPDLQIHSDALLIFPSRAAAEPESLRSLYELRRQGVRFVEFYDFYESLTRRVHLETLTEMWFVQSIDYGSHQFSDAIKRMMDLLISFIGLVVLVVTFPLAALLIKLSSPGAIFFTQARVGKNGQPFNLIKYRTMSGGATNVWTEKNDSRITVVGKWLRRLRIDELPQMINIFKGEMSLVGPRPEQVHIVEQLKGQIPYYDERHMVKPGLTGWAQLHVYAGSLEETKRKLQYDLYYIKNRGFLFDWEIILRTIYKIVTFSGQ